jgi:hypothetical protein
MRREAYWAELEVIAERNGGFLRPEAVVEFARDPETALHQYFTWDDAEAGHHWRLTQARQLIRVAVTVMPGNDQTRYRAFVSLKGDRYSGLGYRPTVTVLSDDAMRRALLQEAQEEMRSFMERYKSLKELAAVFMEMQKVVGQPTVKRKYKRRPAQASIGDARQAEVATV